MEINYEKMWQEIVEGIHENEKADYEKSISDFMEETGLTKYEARKYLDDKVKEGVLVRRTLKNGGFVYSPAIKTAQ